jgi:hypothetical protein
MSGTCELSHNFARSNYPDLPCSVGFVPLVLGADHDSDYNKRLKIGSDPARDKVVTNQQFAVFVS